MKLPLVAQGGEDCYDIHDRALCVRAAGDVLNPARMTPQDAEKLRLSLPPHVWNSQYQQQPVAGGSGMLSLSKFKRYDIDNAPEFDLEIHSWDLGATVNGNASVCTQWGLRRSNKGRDLLYLKNVVRVRLEVPEVRATIIAEMEKHDPALVVLDERGVGIGIFQDLRKHYGRRIARSTETEEPIQLAGSTKSRPSASKIDRFARASLFIGDGLVFVPKDGPWLDAFLYELASFPNIADKDQADSMAQVIGNFQEVIRIARSNVR